MMLSKHAAARLRWAKDPRAAARGGFWLTLLYYVIVFALSEILRPKPKLENAKPAGLGDFSFPTATEERFVPLLWGTVQITGPNVVWWGNLVQEAITEKVKTGMFSSDTITKGYRYSVGIQSALCRGTVNSLLRVWIGDDEVFSGTVAHGGTFTINEPELFGGEDLGSGGVVGTLKFFAGGNTQAVSSYLAQFQQVGVNLKTPAYRGTCYVTSDTEPVYVGNSTSIKPWKYELRRIPNGLGLSGSGAVNTADSNPMNVVYEVLTDLEWGLAIPSSMIDTASFTAAGNTCATEGNGFSYLLDSPIEASEIIALIEQQVSGIVFFNQLTGKFQVRLARADYVLGSIPDLNDTNILEFNSFARGSWEDTTNFIRSQFNDRADNYKGTFALAIDSANIRIQEGAIVSSTVSYPGVKDRDLANDLAWRDLRTLAIPLAKANITVDATNYALQPGQPIKITNADLGVNGVAFRITRIDYGEMTDNKIKLDLVEDVFYYLAASFGAPIDSGWEPPLDNLQAFLTLETLKFESPRAFNARDPFSVGPADNRIFASARKRGVEVTFKVYQKTDGAPDSAYLQAAEGVKFLRIGELTSALDTTGAVPITTLNITCTPDAQARLLELFQDAPSAAVLGLDLSQLVMIDNEFILVTDASASGATVNLENVYRAVMDSPRAKHAAGADVWMLSGGGFVGGVTCGPFNELASIDLKLVPRSASDIVALASCVEEEVDMAKRSRRPYPPSRVSIGGTAWATTVALEQLGGGAEVTGFASTWLRRDYRTGDGADEIAALTVDAATLFASFPTANTTVHTVRIYNDPLGANTLLLTYSSLGGTSQNQLRLAILKATNGVLPTRLAIEIDAIHTDNGEVLTARYTLRHEFNITTALTGQFNFGAKAANLNSNIYTATVAGTYALTLSSAFTLGNVQASINGGAFATIIAAGATTGNILGVLVSDTITLRHTSTDVLALKQLDVNAPGAGQDGYMVLFT